MRLALGLFVGLAAGCATGPASNFDDVLSPSEADVRPVPLYQPSPVYPPDLRLTHPDGSVVVSFVVGFKGEVLDPGIDKPQSLSASELEFGEAAVRAVREWQFKPGQKDGAPARVLMRVRFVFQSGETG